jgi:putative FmdB family regulatory protein
MPLYDYQCKDCGETFEVRATIQEKIAGLDLVCVKCGSRETRQLLTAAMMVHGGKEFSPSGCGPNAGPGCCG